MKKSNWQADRDNMIIVVLATHGWKLLIGERYQKLGKDVYSRKTPPFLVSAHHLQSRKRKKQEHLYILLFLKVVSMRQCACFVIETLVWVKAGLCISIRNDSHHASLPPAEPIHADPMPNPSVFPRPLCVTSLCLLLPTEQYRCRLLENTHPLRMTKIHIVCEAQLFRGGGTKALKKAPFKSHYNRIKCPRGSFCECIWPNQH